MVPAKAAAATGDNGPPTCLRADHRALKLKSNLSQQHNHFTVPLLLSSFLMGEDDHCCDSVRLRTLKRCLPSGRELLPETSNPPLARGLLGVAVDSTCLLPNRRSSYGSSESVAICNGT